MNAGAQTTPKPPCCGVCQDVQKSCRVDTACCLECHFAYEEKHCFPYLPFPAQRALRREHQRLVRLGFPHRDLHAHTQEEMIYFRRYCPPDLVAQIDHDHREYEAGHLHSRNP